MSCNQKDPNPPAKRPRLDQNATLWPNGQQAGYGNPHQRPQSHTTTNSSCHTFGLPLNFAPVYTQDVPFAPQPPSLQHVQPPFALPTALEYQQTFFNPFEQHQSVPDVYMAQPWDSGHTQITMTPTATFQPAPSQQDVYTFSHQHLATSSTRVPEFYQPMSQSFPFEFHPQSFLQSYGVHEQPQLPHAYEPGRPIEHDTLSLDRNPAQNMTPCIPHTDKDLMICFGTITSIPGEIDEADLPGTMTQVSVELRSGTHFATANEPIVKGCIIPQGNNNQLIQQMLNDSTLRLYAMCNMEKPATGSVPCRKFDEAACTLDVTIYGYKNIYQETTEFDEFGSWLQDWKVYLQDPLCCHLDTKYCNPHKLSTNAIDTGPLVSDIISKAAEQISFLDIPESVDMLDMLNSRCDLEEAKQPAAITAKLKRHQKQALTFMLCREQGWGPHNGKSDIWRVMKSSHQRVFVNMVSETRESEEPPQFYGGIIADAMGLGKTLTMIALVATDLEHQIQAKVPKPGPEEVDCAYIEATLIIIPPPLIGSWEEQLSDHVSDGGLKWCRHHGKSRLGSNSQSLKDVNVVLTTYHTVSAEWNTARSKKAFSLFGVRWRRIILDEAHYIRNENSKMARAICELNAVSRWAVTGTPIQNRLSDLATLVKFIRAYPYTDTREFDADITQLWKSGHEEKATLRLQHLSASIILRRAKGTITLPPKHDKLCPVDFSPKERAAYEKIRQSTITSVEEALSHNARPESSNVRMYHNALHRIESLRLFCDLGLGYYDRHGKFEDDPPAVQQDWQQEAQRLFNLQWAKVPMVCLGCSCILDPNEALTDQTEGSETSSQYTRCFQFICGECVKRASRAGRALACNHQPPCPVASVSTHYMYQDSTASNSATETSESALPSKVKVLMSDLACQPPDVKSIVFSTWRMTLDVVEQALKTAGKGTVRFDGHVSLKDRQAAIQKFRNDPTVEVMLLTLSCGAVGLNLTVATRVYLMEPHWNPNLEEQALARVHRIGQTREVTTVRLYMRDSFEEQVMKTQEKKKQLSSLLLSPHDGSEFDDSISSLPNLRSLL